MSKKADIHVYIDEDLKQEFEELCADMHISTSAYVRMMIVKEVRANKGAK